MNGNIIVGQSGGPTAVINSSVAGVYSAAKKLGVKKIYGMVHGIQGFLEENFVDLMIFQLQITVQDMVRQQNTLQHQ